MLPIAAKIQNDPRLTKDTMLHNLYLLLRFLLPQFSGEVELHSI